MGNSLAQKFTFSKLVLFTLPNIIMMVFLSLYTIVDGIFVSKYVGTTALSSINMVYPAISIQMAVAIMLVAGGSAVIATKLGEGKRTEAQQNFSLIVLVELTIGLFVLIVGNIFTEEIVLVLGASEAQFQPCMIYGRILFAFAPLFFLQTAFQTLFVTAGKPTLGLLTTVAGGVANIILDYLFMGILGFGIEGAAIATGIGYSIPAIAGLYYFGILKRGDLYFVKPVFNMKVLNKSMSNGFSEMVTNLANAVTTFLFNYLFLKYYGEDGVASITIVLYFQFVFSAIFFGYAQGVAPITSYQYGSNDVVQLKRTIKNSIIFIGICSLTAFLLSLFIVDPITTGFTPKGSNVYQITVEGFPILACSFLFMGISIYASSMFTALSDGKTSAIISFARTLVFLVGGLLLLPLWFHKKGLWLAVPVAEILGLIVSIFYLVKNKKKYKY